MAAIRAIASVLAVSNISVPSNNLQVFPAAVAIRKVGTAGKTARNEFAPCYWNLNLISTRLPSQRATTEFCSSSLSLLNSPR